MNSYIKHATISTLLCSVIILLNTDLSCLKPFGTRVALALEKRQIVTQYETQGYTTVIPDEYLLSVKKDVYSGMSTAIQSMAKDKTTVVNSFHTSQDVDCRGSPLNRSP